MRQPPPEARMSGETLGELFKMLAKFAKGNRKFYIALIVVWLVLHIGAIALLPALNVEKGLVYVAFNMFGVALGALISYLGLRWSIVSWRSTKWLPMILASVVTIVGLVILVACPLIFEYISSFNHAVYLCMVDRGMTTRAACDAIVSEQYQNQPYWRPFVEYRPQR